MRKNNAVSNSSILPQIEWVCQNENLDTPTFFCDILKPYDRLTSSGYKNGILENKKSKGDNFISKGNNFIYSPNNFTPQKSPKKEVEIDALTVLSPLL